MKKVLDASNCKNLNEIIDLMESDIKRRKSICFKVKKFFKKMF